MRGKSHIRLGNYLAQRYLQDIPEKNIQAFLFGCIEPDRNPLSYLKGSMRCQWLRGHNYRNACRFMRRISRRLEQRNTWNLFDYYTLGKLIHDTADVLTYAHNDSFPTNLTKHREYEIRLQEYFLNYLQSNPRVDVPIAKTVMEAIGNCHREYYSVTSDIHRDSRFALQACCCVLTIL